MNPVVERAEQIKTLSGLALFFIFDAIEPKIPTWWNCLPHL
jgi:hypothetical protein